MCCSVCPRTKNGTSIGHDLRPRPVRRRLRSEAPRTDHGASGTALHRAGQDRRLPGARRPTRQRRLLPLHRAARPRTVDADDRRHDLPPLLDDQADHVGRAHDAARTGALPAERPGVALHTVMEGPSGVGVWRGCRHEARSAKPADDDARPFTNCSCPTDQPSFWAE